MNEPINRPSGSKWNNSCISKSEIGDDIWQMESLIDLMNDGYVISSHRPILGKALVKGRELVHGEVRRYLDPIISQQTELNYLLIDVLYKLARKNHELSAKINMLENRVLIADHNCAKDLHDLDVNNTKDDLRTDTK